MRLGLHLELPLSLGLGLDQRRATHGGVLIIMIARLRASQAGRRRADAPLAELGVPPTEDRPTRPAGPAALPVGIRRSPGRRARPGRGAGLARRQRRAFDRPLSTPHPGAG
jgi:hypothetical protein